MRIKWAMMICEIGFAILALGLLFVAVFAYQLHIDNNQTWGLKRIIMASLGGFCLLFSAGLVISSLFRRLRIPRKLTHFITWTGSPIRWLFQKADYNQEISRPDITTHKSGWFAVLGAGIAIFLAFWYITSGRIVSWTSSTTYFDRLANAFLAGQLSLLETPPPALVALPNPYQIANRHGVSGYIWDSSLYQGKYYYYWGPVPAVMAAVIKVVKQTVVQDQYLIMFSITGLAIILAALFYWLRKVVFPRIPGWFIFVLCLLGILNTPVFWLVNHPAVHEVPIAVGQLFLILGLFSILRGMQGEKHKGAWMVVAGFSFGASIGSRVNNAPAIAWMIGIASLFVIFKSKTKWSWVNTMVALLVPLLICGSGLAWYNFARFGNIFETGHRYQLTGGGMPADYSRILSINYVLPNLYNLLARPMDIHWREFPFLFTPFLRENMWPALIFYPRDPNYFYSEPITGLFIPMPVIWLVFLPAVGLFRIGWNWLVEKTAVKVRLKDRPLSFWAGWMVAGALVCNLATLAVFITSNMRYEADLTPLLTILIAICIGWASDFFQSRHRLWNLVLILAAGLCMISVFIGLLTNFQNGDWIFQNNNPHLYQVISQFFTGK